MLDYLTLKTSKSQELLDITEQINLLIEDKDVKTGLCCVFALHATAGVIINENWDNSVRDDFLDRLKKLIPDHDNYLHDKVDNNAAAHLKSAIVGPSVTIPIENGKLLLGQWQAVMFCEFDGPRAARRIAIHIIPGTI